MKNMTTQLGGPDRRRGTFFRRRPARDCRPYPEILKSLHFAEDVAGWPESRRGVALILVLGLLALMTVMGITFSIYMRTERVAAGNFLSDVKTRNLLHVALNRALADIRASMSNNAVYPPWDVLVSSAAGESVKIAVVSNAFEQIPLGAMQADGTSLAQLPYLQASAVVGVQYGTVLNLTDLSFATITQVVGTTVFHTLLQGGTRAYWMVGDQYKIIAPRWITAGIPNEGRVGYAVINCSGLLDANYAGGAARNAGTNANEIQIVSLPEVNPGSLNALYANRPYETVQELSAIGTSVGGLLSRPVSLLAYSANPLGDGSNSVPVDLAGDANALSLQAGPIVSGLVQSGLTASEAAFVFTNLLDYVDADSIPRHLASACTESVPMINEVVATNFYRFGTNGIADLRSRVYVEWFYPFVRPASNTFWISYTASLEAMQAPAGFVLPAPASGTIDALYANGVFCFNTLYFNLPNVSFNYSGMVGQSVDLVARVALRVREGSSSGAVVDAAPFADTLIVRLPVVTVPSVPAVTATNVGAVSSAECFDPRFNWTTNAGQWRVTRGGAGSLGLMNPWTTNQFAQRDTDGHPYMYVADRPLLSPSELTYLLRGNNPNASSVPLHQWNTIRLFDRMGPINPMPLDRVLDFFVVGRTGVVKGLVNINTDKQDVMRSLFLGSRVNSFPGDSAGVTVNQVDADSLARFWVTPSSNMWAGQFTRLSEIGHLTNVFTMAPYAGQMPFRQESFFVNNCGLMGTRQNYFIILLYAQHTKIVPTMREVNVVSGLMGIAEVWRDPARNAAGRDALVVRSFKVLNE